MSLMFRPSFGQKSTSRPLFRPIIPARSTLQCVRSPMFRPMPKSNSNPPPRPMFRPMPKSNRNPPPRPIAPIYSTNSSSSSENSKKPKSNSVNFEFSLSSLISFLVGTCCKELVLVWKELTKELTKTHIAYLLVFSLVIIWALWATGNLKPSLEEEGFCVTLKNGLSGRLGITKTIKDILELKILYKKPKEDDDDDDDDAGAAKDGKKHTAKEMKIEVDSVTIHCITVNVIASSPSLPSSDDSDTA